MLDRPRFDPDDRAADRVERDLVITHHDELHVERLGRQHPPFAGDDRVDAHELRLDDVLKIGDLLVQAVVVIDEAVTVVLDPDVVFHREGDRRPRVRLELGGIDEEVCLRDRLGREHVVAQALLVGVANLDLGDFFEEVAFDALHAGQHFVEPAGLEGRARRHGDAASLTDRELRHRVAAGVFQRQEKPLGELGASVRVREHLACADEVRLDERAPLGDEA